MLPLPSVTVQVTVVVPNKNVDGASFVTDDTEQLSFVTGDPNTTFVDPQATFVVPLVADGAVIVGLILSVTVTVYEHVTALVTPSVAVQVTVVIPLLKAILFKVVPVPEVTPLNVYVSDVTPQLSVAVAFQSVPDLT